MGACASKTSEASGNGPNPTEPSPADNSVCRDINAPTETEETVEAPLVDISEPEPEKTKTESEQPKTDVVVEELASGLKELNTEAPAQPNKEETDNKDEETKAQEEKSQNKDESNKTDETPGKEETKAAN